jgi:hypothetical protein
VAAAAASAALLLAGWSLTPDLVALPYQKPLVAVALLTSAAVLGWSLIAMLLGHWYLVAPRLTFRHLVIFCWALLLMMVARGAALAATMAVAGSVDPTLSPHPIRVLVDFGGQGMFFWFRLLWGLGGPLVLAWMALHCARRRSNQSATGILYVLVVGAFVGEVTAYYLLLTTGIPV